MQSDVWELIRMLATNEKVHERLLPTGEQNAQQFWNETFNDPNEYMKIYKQDIIYDLMEKDGIDDIRRVKWIHGFDGYYASVYDNPKTLRCIQTEPQKKRQWTEKFLADNQGFNYIKDKFFALRVKQLVQEQLKETAFWSTLMQNNFEEKKLNDDDLGQLTRHSLDLLHRLLQKKITVKDKEG